MTTTVGVVAIGIPAPVLDLVLVVAWVAIAAGVPTIRRARAGMPSPMRRADARGSAAWWARTVAVIGLGLAIPAPIAAIAGLPASEPFDRPEVRLAGVVLVVLGIGLTLIAQESMGASWRADVDPDARTPLVTTGPFAIIRNPILAAGMVVQLGLALLVPNVASLLMLVAFQIAARLQVRHVEEPYLRRVHGDAYRAYAARTGRFLPGIGRLRG